MTFRWSLSMAAFCSCALTAPALAANPPANICVELTGWIAELQPKPAGRQASAQALQQERAGQGAAENAGSPAVSTAVEEARPGGGQTPEGTDPVQRSSGISGSVTPEGPGAAGPQGDAQESAKSGAINPKPEDKAQQSAETAKPQEPKAPPPSAEAIEKARQSAGAADVEACAAVVRDMRLAGVALPTPLIALAALKPELLRAAPQGPAPGVPPIPPSGVQATHPATDPATGDQPNGLPPPADPAR